MERKLKSLFDYQNFEKNPRLEKLISETENRYARELSDDDLSFVNAAGDFNMRGATISENEISGKSGTPTSSDLLGKSVNVNEVLT